MIRTGLGAVPGLGRDEVHVWLAGLDVARQPDDLAPLSAEERRRAARFHFERDRRRFTAARSCLRRLLGAYLGVSPAAIAFGAGPQGKPHLAGPPAASGLRFNLSHAGDLALIAVTREREVGADVECIRPVADLARLAASCFSPAERAQLLALQPDDRLAAFFRGWTRKEAYLKARGIGLSCAPERVEVSVRADEPARLLGVPGGPCEAMRWSLWGLTPAPEAVGAVVVEGRGCRLTCLEAGC
jgi:4'-phosphopantetheinyl transferase